MQLKKSEAVTLKSPGSGPQEGPQAARGSAPQQGDGSARQHVRREVRIGVSLPANHDEIAESIEYICIATPRFGQQGSWALLEGSSSSTSCNNLHLKDPGHVRAHSWLRWAYYPPSASLTPVVLRVRARRYYYRALPFFWVGV